MFAPRISPNCWSPPPTVQGVFQLFRKCGWLPQSNDRRAYHIYGRIISVSCAIFNICIFASITTAKTMPDLIDVLLVSITFFLAFVKAMLFRYNLPNIEHAFWLMSKLHPSKDDPSDEIRSRMARADRLVRIVNLTVMTPYYIGCFTIGLSTVLAGNRLIYSSWFPFDWSAYRFVYFATISYQMISQTWLSLLMSSSDTTGPILYCYLIAYLEILGIRLRKVGESWFSKDGKTTKGRNSDIQMEAQLKDCVRYHQTCLEYVF